MKIQVIEEPKMILSNPHSKHNYFAWPSVTRLQNGKIAVVASGFRLAHVCPFGKAVIAYSEDEGQSYTAPAAIIDTVLDDRDAGIANFGETGVIVTSFNNSIGFQRGWAEKNIKDLGLKTYINAYLDTVSTQEEQKILGATYRVSHDCGKSFGELRLSPITSPHGPVSLKDGTLLWVGRKFDKNDDFVGKENLIKAYRINPDETMTYLGEIENIPSEDSSLNPCEPYAIEAEDGTIICHIRSSVFTIYQSESYDGGHTWSHPHRILEPTGGAPAHLLKHSSGILISAYGYRKKPFGIRVACSRDNGRTWDTDHILYADGPNADLGYPATVELSDGSLLTVFYAQIGEKEISASYDKVYDKAASVIYQMKWRIVEL